MRKREAARLRVCSRFTQSAAASVLPSGSTFNYVPNLSFTVELFLRLAEVACVKFRVTDPRAWKPTRDPQCTTAGDTRHFKDGGFRGKHLRDD